MLFELFLVALAMPQELPFPAPLRPPPSAYRDQPVRSMAPGGPPKILFLNFDGGRLMSSAEFCDDAIRNCSSIVPRSLGSVDIPPFIATDVVRQQILDFVGSYYEPFNVNIVTTRPASAPYEMTMVGGNAGIVGSNPRALGLAFTDCGDRNGSGISFAFPESVNNRPREVAIIIAQETAHALGLGHTDDRRDVMYPTLTVGMPTAVGFLNYTMNIFDAGGSYSGCDGSRRQNSFRMLINNIGGAPDPEPPTAAFMTPMDGEEVPSGFRVEIAATDNRGVNSVELFANGSPLGGAADPPYQFDIPPTTFPKGPLRLMARVKDYAANQTDTPEITVRVRALGETPGDLGTRCTMDSDCLAGGFCALDSGSNRRFCTFTCTPPGGCPRGFKCAGASGGTNVCAASGGDGGCSVASVAWRAGGASAGGIAVLLLASAFGLAVRRRLSRRRGVA